MKKITPYLLSFIVVATLLAIVFRCALTYALNHEIIFMVHLSCVLYFIFMFANGWYFGRKDNLYLPIYSAGFRFHFTTYFIFVLVSELWFVFGFNSHYENVNTVHITAIIWGFLVLVHFIVYLILRKKSFKGLDKEELFD